jgi:hypothetical protein
MACRCQRTLEPLLDGGRLRKSVFDGKTKNVALLPMLYEEMGGERIAIGEDQTADSEDVKAYLRTSASPNRCDF